MPRRMLLLLGAFIFAAQCHVTSSDCSFNNSLKGCCLPKPKVFVPSTASNGRDQGETSSFHKKNYKTKVNPGFVAYKSEYEATAVELIGEVTTLVDRLVDIATMLKLRLLKWALESPDTFDSHFVNADVELAFKQSLDTNADKIEAVYSDIHYRAADYFFTVYSSICKSIVFNYWYKTHNPIYSGMWGGESQYYDTQSTSGGGQLFDWIEEGTQAQHDYDQDETEWSDKWNSGAWNPTVRSDKASKYYKLNSASMVSTFKKRLQKVDAGRAPHTLKAAVDEETTDTTKQLVLTFKDQLKIPTGVV